MTEMNIDFSKYSRAINIALGGTICLLANNIFLSTSQVAIRVLFLRFDCLGLLIFSEVRTAISLFILGTVYLTSGFCCGLYIGFKIKETLRIVAAFPALIGFGGSLILRVSPGNADFSILNIVEEILMPLLANIAGSYLGGYTVANSQQEVESKNN